VSLVFNVTGGDAITIEGSSNDGNGDFQLAASDISIGHHFLQPGMTIVKAVAFDNFNTTVQTGIAVQV